jgi:hypothetical protein
MLVDFTGFAGDCLISGRLDLRADWLTDQRNAEPEIKLIDVLLEGLLDGRQVMTPTFTIRRSELCAVKAGPPRGSRTHWTPTEPHRLQARLGLRPGRLHAPPGTEALETIGQRGVMVRADRCDDRLRIAGLLESATARRSSSTVSWPAGCATPRPIPWPPAWCPWSPVRLIPGRRAPGDPPRATVGTGAAAP